VPFVICRSEAGLADFKARDVAARSKQLALAFGLPYVLTVSKPVQPAKGLASYAASAEKGIPAILAEAGGVGQMQDEAVELLVNGVVNVMRHLGMIAGEHPHLNPLPNKGEEGSGTVLTKFEWVYTKSSGIWYPDVAPGDVVNQGEQIGTVGDLFGETLERVNSPVNGVVLFLTINPSVLENGLLMGLGVE
jgi:predicted deacylase